MEKWTQYDIRNKRRSDELIKIRAKVAAEVFATGMEKEFEILLHAENQMALNTLRAEVEEDFENKLEKLAEKKAQELIAKSGEVVAFLNKKEITKMKQIMKKHTKKEEIKANGLWSIVVTPVGKQTSVMLLNNTTGSIYAVREAVNDTTSIASK